MKRDGSGLLYRTPADVRAIQNTQWERWIKDETLPFPSFAATRDVQMTLRYVLKATVRRMSA